MSGRGEPKAKRAKTGTYIPLNMPFQHFCKDGKKFFLFFFSFLPFTIIAAGFTIEGRASSTTGDKPAPLAVHCSVLLAVP